MVHQVPTRLASYQMISLIGTGTYGKVYKVIIKDQQESSQAGLLHDRHADQEPEPKQKQRQDPQWYVLKQVPLQGLSPSEQRETVKESELMNTIGDHESLVAHYASFIEHDCLNIVMEYCAGGDLSTRIKQARERDIDFDEETIWMVMIQVCSALKHLHSHRVLHRDIKPENIFLDAYGSVKVGDLGLGRLLSSQSCFAHSTVGTPLYFSPELCEESLYDERSDVWALGCLVYQLCTLKPPFLATNQLALAKKIVYDDPLPLPTFVSKDLKFLTYKMLEKEPQKRPDATQILEHGPVRLRTLQVTFGRRQRELKREHQRREANLTQQISNLQQERDNSVSQFNALYADHQLLKNQHRDLCAAKDDLIRTHSRLVRENAALRASKRDENEERVDKSRVNNDSKLTSRNNNASNYGSPKKTPRGKTGTNFSMKTPPPRNDTSRACRTTSGSRQAGSATAATATGASAVSLRVRQKQVSRRASLSGPYAPRVNNNSINNNNNNNNRENRKVSVSGVRSTGQLGKVHTDKAENVTSSLEGGKIHGDGVDARVYRRRSDVAFVSPFALRSNAENACRFGGTDNRRVSNISAASAVSMSPHLSDNASDIEISGDVTPSVEQRHRESRSEDAPPDSRSRSDSESTMSGSPDEQPTESANTPNSVTPSRPAWPSNNIQQPSISSNGQLSTGERERGGDRIGTNEEIKIEKPEKQKQQKQQQQHQHAYHHRSSKVVHRAQVTPASAKNDKPLFTRRKRRGMLALPGSSNKNSSSSPFTNNAGRRRGHNHDNDNDANANPNANASDNYAFTKKHNPAQQQQRQRAGGTSSPILTDDKLAQVKGEGLITARKILPGGSTVEVTSKPRTAVSGVAVALRSNNNSRDCDDVATLRTAIELDVKPDAESFPETFSQFTDRSVSERHVSNDIQDKDGGNNTMGGKYGNENATNIVNRSDLNSSPSSPIQRMESEDRNDKSESEGCDETSRQAMLTTNEIKMNDFKASAVPQLTPARTSPNMRSVFSTPGMLGPARRVRLLSDEKPSDALLLPVLWSPSEEVAVGENL